MSEHDPSASHDTHEPSWFPPVARRFLWADDPLAVKGLIKGLTALCVVLFLLDFIVHRHAKVPGEGLWGFHAIVGFVSFTLIVLGAGKLRTFIGRREDYYAPRVVDAEAYPDKGLDVREHRPDDAGDGQQLQTGKTGQGSIPPTRAGSGGARS